MARQMDDVRLDDDDLLIAAGDFTIVDGTQQHQEQLLLNTKGDFKENPTICVGAFNYLDDERFQGLLREISIEFSRDGMEVYSLVVDEEGRVITNAVYT